MLSILVAASLIAFADPAPAPEGGTLVAPATAKATAEAAAAAKEKAKGSEKVCWDEAPTGSHYTKRFCATRDELAQRERQDKDSMNQHTRTRGKPGIGPS